MSVDKIRGHQTLQVSWRGGGMKKNVQNFQGFNNFKALEYQSQKIGTVTLKVNPGYFFRSKIPCVSNCPRLTLGAWQGCMYLGCCSHLRGPAPAITPLNGPQCVIKRLAQWLCKYGLLAHRRDFCLFSLLWYMAIRFKRNCSSLLGRGNTKKMLKIRPKLSQNDLW